MKLKGTNASNRLTLKSAGTTNFTGGGIFQLDYVHFATGTWTSSATNLTITNCTRAASVTVPSAWGCVAPAVSAAVDLADKEQPHTFAREISQ